MKELLFLINVLLVRILKKKNEEINDSGRRIRTFNRKKVEENKEENNEEKRDIH